MEDIASLVTEIFWQNPALTSDKRSLIGASAYSCILEEMGISVDPDVHLALSFLADCMEEEETPPLRVALGLLNETLLYRVTRGIRLFSEMRESLGDSVLDTHYFKNVVIA